MRTGSCSPAAGQQRRDRGAQQWQRIAAFRLAVTRGGRPAAHVAQHLLEVPAQLQRKRRVRQLVERKRQRRVVSLDVAPLRRPVRPHDIYGRTPRSRRRAARRRIADADRSTPRAARPGAPRAAPRRRTPPRRTSGAPAPRSRDPPRPPRARSAPRAPPSTETRGCGFAAAICSAAESVANTREKCAASGTLAWPLPQPQSHTASRAGAARASHSNSSGGYPGRNSEYSHATVENSCVLDMRTFYA